ncbi:DUF2997 domain-containing protein [Nostoc sp. FACHB-888]|uniref:DUF2997 domain-containing protein n=1 Tax=Nostoc sp. FACHB-888 TaxID=2692842 RepID=UPI0016846AA5|nr:DUF2997 domain-containing protein [Nostoc sp. FACHB-888]MBD2249024.1 DUF2997 domain-containing protein [Nostoc sp. FACHB-888]
MERSILIHFDNATGEVRVEAEGFEGLSCLSATQPFEEALGVVSESDRTLRFMGGRNRKSPFGYW